MPANSWGEWGSGASSLGTGDQWSNWGQYGQNINSWQNYLQGQTANYNMQQPQAPNVTQGQWKDLHQTVMNDMLSGQRNMINDYVRRAGMTGVQRGGFTPATYAPSQNQYAAVQQLAQGYGDRYNQSLDYVQKLAQFQQQQYQAQQQQLANLWQAQQQGLGLQGQATQGATSYEMGLRQLAEAEAERQLKWQSLLRQLGTQQYGYIADLVKTISGGY